MVRILFICEKCGKEHDGSFGSGRFCSESCAHARTHSDETKQKIRESLNNYLDGLDPNRLTKQQRIEKNILRKQEKRIDFVNTVFKENNAKFITYPDIDFGNNYIVTSKGFIFSVLTLREISQGVRDDGYRYVCLRDINHKQHNLLVHRLVAIAFIPNPNNYPIINHKDENTSNNNEENLEWCTYKYNNTYNDRHIKTGKKISENIIRNGGQWSKGLKKDKNNKFIR